MTYPCVCCQALYRPDMSEEEVEAVVGHCMMAAMERNCQSGYGFVVHVINREGIRTTKWRGRMD
jgi:20S proteasome alpha/beta subunit